MDNNDRLEQSAFSIAPERRLDLDFPWQAWAIGLLSVVKAVLWLVVEPPALPQEILHLLLIKYLAAAFPFIIFGIGAWNLSKWAAIGLTLFCLAEVLFFIIYPTSCYSFPINITSIMSFIYSALVFLVNSPASDIFILICAPALFKHSGSYTKQ